MSRVALTGASGFVGRHTLTALLDAGHEVHALARHVPGRNDPRGVIWHEVDLLAASGELADGGPLAEIRPEVLVHLAWYGEHGLLWESPANARWVEASLALLRGFAAAGGRRAVMAGSCAEYEWSRDLYSEDAPLIPSSVYGGSKHALHVGSAGFARQAGIQLAWARLFFMYGPYERAARLVPSIVLPLLAGSPAAMTDGLQRRDFLHVGDVGAALAALAGSDLEGAVNVASGEAIEVRALAARLGELTGRPELLRLGVLPRRERDPPVLRADVRRLRDELGWRPSIALDDGLCETIAWWRGRAEAAPANR